MKKIFALLILAAASFTATSATLVEIDRNVPLGYEMLTGVQNIRDGLAAICKHDGTRAQTIGVNDGAVTFAAVFGITANAQAFNDRMGSICAKSFAGLSDFIDATLAQVPGTP